MPVPFSLVLLVPFIILPHLIFCGSDSTFFLKLSNIIISPLIVSLYKGKPIFIERTLVFFISHFESQLRFLSFYSDVLILPSSSQPGHSNTATTLSTFVNETHRLSCSHTPPHQPNTHLYNEWTSSLRPKCPLLCSHRCCLSPSGPFRGPVSPSCRITRQCRCSVSVNRTGTSVC